MDAKDQGTQKKTLASPAKEPRKRLSFRAKLGWMVLATVIGLEGTTRVVDRVQGRNTKFYLPVLQGDSVYRPHPFLTYELVPNYSREGMFSFHHNSLGFRGKETTVEKPEGVYRILCVGGSTTYGTSCTKDEFSYPAQLEAMLAEDVPGKKYEVINCGVSGYGTVENLINIELRLLELDPDAIIVYHAANDARPIQARGFKSDYSHLRTNWHVPESNKLDYNLLRISRFYAWMTRGRDPEKRARALFSCIAVEDFEDLHQPSNLGVPEEGIAAFARNLKSMVAIARANDVELVLSTFASCRAIFKPDGEHFLDTIDRINDAVTELAAELNVPLLNIAPKLSDKPKIFSDWMHLTDEGCKLQAQAVYDEAKRIGALGL